MLKPYPRVFALLIVPALVLSGCGQTPPAKPPVAETPKVTPAPVASMAGGTLTPTTPTRGSNAGPATFAEAAYLDDDVFGLVVAHPRQLTSSPIFAMVKDMGLLEEMKSQLPIGFFNPEETERVTLVIDQELIDTLASAAGLREPTAQPEAPQNQKMNLQRIGLMFYNYQDTFLSFPRSDGDGPGMRTGLSWRVHVLPFLGDPVATEVYSQFHLDEPWDSEHNKTLIEKMPAIFSSPGVDEIGKTAIHVFTGNGSAFDGDKGKGLREFTDGTSNTILAVVAGADTADYWTKPGGLEFDPASSKKALGTIAGESFYVLFSDGSVRSLKTSVSEPLLAKMIQINDGSNIIEEVFAEIVPEKPQEPRGIPTMIVTMTNPLDAADIRTQLSFSGNEESCEGETFLNGDSSALWFADKRTFVFGPTAAVKRTITAKKSGKSGGANLSSQLDLSADLTLALNIESQAALIQQAVESNPLPGIALVQQINLLGLHLNVSGPAGTKLVRLAAITAGDDSAAMISGLLQGLLAQGKLIFQQSQVQADSNPTTKIVRSAVESAALTHDASRIEFSVAIPEGFGKLIDLVLKPALEKARDSAELVKKQNRMRMIGLAFHNYESAFRAFPGAGSSAAGQKGLSWRVHLLPLLDCEVLYNRFKLDEPWDSEHNKRLIDQMPEIYKSGGVSDVGKTSFHVFTGPGALFENEKTPKFTEITDGASNTILFVEAGPDTADVWTKPGGLDFDPKNPLQALGNLVGDTISALMCDGSVRNFPKTISPAQLRQAIQIADGEAPSF